MSWKEILIVAGAAALLVAADPAPVPQSFDYNVVAVKRKLICERPTGEERLEAGAVARSGDLLRTGWRSSAELEVAEFGSRFRLGSSTRVRLGHEHPAVLLEVQEGRVRALFAPLSEDAERLVITPSAVLAVRGTEYGVEVASNGTTTLTVFAGVVDVADRYRAGGTIQVGAGQSTRVQPGRPPEPPRPHSLDRGDWDAGRRPDTGTRPGAGGFDPGAPGSAGAPGSTGAPGGSPGQPGVPPGAGQPAGGGKKGRGGG